MSKEQNSINNTVESILHRTVKSIMRSYPVPDKVFIPYHEWEVLHKELEEWCKFNDQPGPLSSPDYNFSHVLVCGVPIGIQETING